MSKSKHTPGPWIVYADTPSVYPNWHIVTTENKMRVLANVHIEPGNAMDKANAHLIAAAPDMLEALEQLIAEKAPSYHDCIDNGEPACVWCISSAAIAKAKGQS